MPPERLTHNLRNRSQLFTETLFTFMLSLARFVFYLLFFIPPCLVFSQSSLDGKITNDDGIPVEFCKLFLKQDSILIQSVYTDSLGNFSFNTVPDGIYLMSILTSAVRLDTTITVSGTTFFHFTVNNIQEIDGASVTATKPIVVRKVDRTVFYVSQLPVLAGTSSYEALEIAPGVFINDNNILLSNGKSARVLLNDKLLPLNGTDLVSFIKSIPSDDIQFIEIIPVPPAKYAANISGGLIHIRLKPSSKFKRINGSIRGTYRQGYYAKGDLGGNFNYQKNKLSIYTNVFLDNGPYLYTGSKTILYPQDTWEESSRKELYYRSLTAGIGVNYQVNPKTELGILYVGNFNRPTETQKSLISIKNPQTLAESIIQNNSLLKTKSDLNSLTFSASRTFDSLGKNISLVVDLSDYAEKENLGFNSNADNSGSSTYRDILNQTKVGIQMLSSGLDFTLPFKHISFTCGAKVSYTDIRNLFSSYDNSSGTPLYDSSLSNTFSYRENIQALYASAEKTIKKWTFQLGLRAENTLTTGYSETIQEKHVYNYFQLTPKLFIMYAPSSKSSFNFSYSRNFYRPGYNQLNPFRVYSNPYSYFVGNPRLKPQITHDFALNYNFNFKWNAGMSFSWQKDVSSTVNLFDSLTLVQTSTYANFMKLSIVSVYLDRSFDWKKYSCRFSFLGSYQQTKADQVISNQSIQNFYCIATFDNTFTLDRSKTFFFSFDIFYISPIYDAIRRVTSYPSMSFELSKSFLGGKLHTSVSFRDPFRIQTDRIKYQSDETRVKEKNYLDSQSMKLKLSYRFGNNTISINEKSSGTTGESGRIKTN